MFTSIRLQVIALMTLLLLASAPVVADVSGSSAIFDSSRGVLSVTPAIEPALKSVVRIVVLAPGDDGQMQVLGSGSGVITGLILTNNHVISEGHSFRVELADGRTTPGTLLGHDAATDIAVLRIHATGLAAITVGDSDSIRVGDCAFAVGYPLGLQQMVTMGLISGLGRHGIGEDKQRLHPFWPLDFTALDLPPPPAATTFITSPPTAAPSTSSNGQHSKHCSWHRDIQYFSREQRSVIDCHSKSSVNYSSLRQSSRRRY